VNIFPIPTTGSIETKSEKRLLIPFEDDQYLNGRNNLLFVWEDREEVALYNLHFSTCEIYQKRIFKVFICLDNSK